MKILGICLGIFALLIFIVLLVRIKILASFDASGFRAKAKVWFYSLELFPRPVKKKNAAPSKKPDEAKKKGKLSDFTDIIMAALEVSPKAVSSIRIDDLKADVAVASDDACKTAMLYGSLSAGCGIILPVLENNFKIKKKKIRVNADFEASEMMVSIDAALSIAVWQILCIALCFFKSFIKKRNSKGMNENGRTRT